ncbi:hypothetical protein K438DRAFT_1564126 [Mycena galopus ATCC 62051]|nr:hypothetical protein K438DRAFT_1564126 [Mycena galopus ATCC 62051]
MISSFNGLDIHFYSGFGHLDVIDITGIQALVGQVPENDNDWAIIDCSGVLVQAQWLGEDDDE